MKLRFSKRDMNHKLWDDFLILDSNLLERNFLFIYMHGEDLCLWSKIKWLLTFYQTIHHTNANLLLLSEEIVGDVIWNSVMMAIEKGDWPEVVSSGSFWQRIFRLDTSYQ